MNADPLEQTHYEHLYHTHYQRVLRLCRLLLADVHEAEDVTQEVFLKLYRACRTQPSHIVGGAWLTRVAVNACHDRRRSGWWKWWRGSQRAAGETWSSDDADSYDVRPVLEAHWHDCPTPEEEALGAERRTRIWQAFRQLSQRQQEVFVLRHLEGWSTDAVANLLGLSVGSVKQHLFRAIRHLRAALGGEA